MSVLMNKSMKLERTDFLCAKPYERNKEFRCHDKGYKSKLVHSRVDALDFQGSQTRGVASGEQFYPTLSSAVCVTIGH